MPQNVEAEQSLLGCIVLDNSIILQIDTRAEMFYNSKNKSIFTAMKELEKIDLVTLGDYFEKNKTNISRSEMAGLVNSVLTATNFKEYAKIVREKWIRRTTIENLSASIRNLYDEEQETENVMNVIKDGILKTASTSRFLVEENPDLVDDWYKAYDKPRILLKTGIATVDNVVGGFSSTDLGLILADTNVGKTTLLLNMAIQMARAGKHVLFFSLEMSSEQLVSKMIAINENINAYEIFTRKTPKDHLHGAVENFKKLPITIVSRGAITSQDVISEAYTRKLTGKVDVVMVDYIQLLTDFSKENETMRLTNIARNLKNFALTNEIPVITPVQVDKASSQGGKIRVENVAWSKEIANASDIAFYLIEEERKKLHISDEAEVDLYLKVVKSRHSSKNSKVRIDFDRVSLRMKDTTFGAKQAVDKFNEK